MPLVHETEAERIARLVNLLTDVKRLRDDHLSSRGTVLPEAEAAIALIEAELTRRKN